MILTVAFPLRNHIQLADPWPIRVGSKIYFMRVQEGLIQKIGVSFQGVSADVAPSLQPVRDRKIQARLHTNSDGHVLEAEHDIRAWQSLLLPYVLLDIDFDSPEMEFKPETLEEQSKIKMPNLSVTKARHPRSGDQYELYGLAFLILDEGRPLIEVMALYREGVKALEAGRFIDAYNNFYLFFETQYCRNTSTRQATDALTSNSEFMTALGMVVEETIKEKDTRELRFKSLQSWKTEPRSLVKEIVELRGHLRHHSLGSPHRWDPDKHEHFNREAVFLGLVANKITFPKTTGKLWEQTVLERYIQLAREAHMAIEIQVKMTIKQGGHIRDIGFAMPVPQPNPSTQLAKSILTKALEMLDEKAPDAELYAIRARVKGRDVELFRYDVGPSLTR